VLAESGPLEVSQVKRVLILSAIGLGVLGLVAAYSDNTEQAKFSTRAENEADARKRKIEAEHKELGEHPWAGKYYEGDGLGVGVSLWIAPKSGFVFEWHGCLGVYDRNYGPVSVADKKLQLSFTFPNTREGFQGLSPELIPVSWGQRRYLVPPDRIVDFCNSVNAGNEPRKGIYGLHLLRRGDEKKSVQGWPNIPREFDRYLLKQAISTEIVAVGAVQTRPSAADWKFKDTRVTLKGGEDLGLRKGMELHVTAPDDVVESISVREVKEHTSEGVMTGIGVETPNPKVGWKLSTQPRWARPGQTADNAGKPGGQ